MNSQSIPAEALRAAVSLHTLTLCDKGEDTEQRILQTANLFEAWLRRPRIHSEELAAVPTKAKGGAKGFGSCTVCGATVNILADSLTAHHYAKDEAVVYGNYCTGSRTEPKRAEADLMEDK
jgi:hypothetical protein